MDTLTGRYVYIILGIEEGRGFTMVKDPFYVSVVVHGKKLDTDCVEGSDITFNTEMVWEIDLNLLKTSYEEYGHIRMECYTKDRKGVGFSLLCLRSAVIDSVSNPLMDNIPIIWTKVLTEGSVDPELCIYFLIRDYTSDVPLMSPLKKTLYMPQLPILPCFSTPQVMIPINYTDDGNIQVGEARGCNKRYQLTITILTGFDLDILLPDNIISVQQVANLQVSIDTFGLEVKTRKFLESVTNRLIDFSEAIILNIQSTYQILGLYFMHFPIIKVRFYAEGHVLGEGDLDMRNLNLDLPEKIFHDCGKKFEMDQYCFLEGEYRATASAEAMRRGIISVECKLEELEPTEYEEVNFIPAEVPTKKVIKSPEHTITSQGDGLASTECSIINLTLGEDPCSGDPPENPGVISPSLNPQFSAPGLENSTIVSAIEDLNQWMVQKHAAFSKDLAVAKQHEIDHICVTLYERMLPLRTELQNCMAKCSSVIADNTRALINDNVHKELEFRILNYRKTGTIDKHKAKYLKLRTRELQKIIDNLLSKSTLRQKILNETGYQLHILRARTFTRYQLDIIELRERHLEKKLEELQMNKSYFKDGCDRAMLAVETLKMDIVNGAHQNNHT